MRIAIICYAAKQYGVFNYVTCLASELRKLGIHVEVFRARFPMEKIGPFVNMIKSSLMSPYLKNFDIVHSNEAAGALIMHDNLIETCHHVIDSKSGSYLLFNGLQHFAYRRAKLIIVPSYFTRKRLLEYGYHPSHIRVIHLGVDTNLFKPDSSLRKKIRSSLNLEDKFVIINVGQLIERKNQAHLIEAISTLDEECRKKIAIILVGSGPEKNRIQVLARKNGINLLNFEYVSKRLLAGLYNAADVYVHVSTLEGFGLTILEAMACGLPVICYRTADFERVVNGAGFIIDQGNLMTLKEKVEYLLHYDKMRRKLATLARERSKLFDWRTTALRHVEVYKEVLNL